MRAVGLEELRHVPFVRHQVDPALVDGAWVGGEAAVVVGVRPAVRGTMRFAAGFGPPTDLAPLLASVDRAVAPPDRVMVTAPADALPPRWQPDEIRWWHWMLSHRRPAMPALAVEEVVDTEEVEALLDRAAPDSHARPGSPGVEAWLGVREDGRLVAAGAVVRQPDGTGHLRAVTVDGDRRGRGLGAALSAALTRRAMADTGTCSLGVYVDNAAALRIYGGLGYEVVHTFTSGWVSGSASTTAVAPSR